MTRPTFLAACLALAAGIAAAAQTPIAAPGPGATPATPVTAATRPDTPATPIVPAAAVPTSAPAAAAPAPIGDAHRGRGLVYTCQGCHGVTGYKNAYPNYHVPRIGGQSAQYLSNALHGYQKGERKHPTMQAQAESFSDADIADIAAYLSGLK